MKKEKPYFGTTGSSSPFLASTASFHLDVHKHHLHPPVKPILRRSFPLEAEKSRNSSVTTAVSPHRSAPCQRHEATTHSSRQDTRKERERRTGNGMIPAVLGAGPTVAVSVEARHRFLREEGEGFLVDCSSPIISSARTALFSFSLLPLPFHSSAPLPPHPALEHKTELNRQRSKSTYEGRRNHTIGIEHGRFRRHLACVAVNRRCVEVCGK